MKYFVLAIMFLFMSCKENNQVKENPLFTKVMEIHDHIMPETSTIHTLKKSLQLLKNTDNEALVLDQITALNKADEAMMQWMADFKVPEDRSKQDIYLKQQLEDIQAVSDEMLRSIKNASVAIDSLKNTPSK
jgi:hypothetical protein